MIPRTVHVAQAVEALFSSTELDEYGNIILNGYATAGPNSAGTLGWCWPDSPLAPAAPLPVVTSVRPAMKGWTTNYMEYYTRADSPAYPVYPGAPTMFDYVVHSFTTGNAPQWAQAPHRFYQNQVSAITPPQNVNNPQVIQYSFMYPVVDNPTQPPIDYVTP
jgi:hypothetical protein